MIDTHTHLYFPEFRTDIGDIIEKCRIEGVTHLVLPNVDKDTIPMLKELHSLYPDYTSMAMGLHPTEIKEDWKDAISLVEDELASGKYKAIGEVGMDLYWDKSKEDLQREAFEYQLELATKYNLPVIIHSRSAIEETIEVINKVKPDVPLIFHSFTGSPSDVRFIRESCDPYFGINGVVTYKNAQSLRDALQEIGLNKILLETDSPYLTPVPHRGKRNDSSYLLHIRDKIAEVLDSPPTTVNEITDKTASSLFL